MKFYNREEEFGILDKLRKDFRVVILGNRRVGKTRLVEEFYKKHCITFFVAGEKAEKEIINGWAMEYEILHLPKVDNFKEFFEFVFVHLKEDVVFIDEIQNISKINNSFFYDLQRLIDKHKPKLIVSGSFISIMKKLIQDYKQPLYDRFDFIIHLKELRFDTVYNICKDLGLDIETSFKLYSIFGGIPKYYELIEKLKKFEFESFVLDMFVSYPRPLYEEVRTMLKEEFGSEHKTFFSILSAISQGKNTSSEIANYIGRKDTEITKYLNALKNDFELIDRKVPVIGSAKKGIYSIKKNIFWFWFNNIWRYNELIEIGQEDKAIEIIKNNLNKHVSFAFEKSIYELLASKKIELPFKYTLLGTQWGKFIGEKGKNTYEIDLMAVNEQKKQILFAECKWQDDVNAAEITNELSAKAQYVEWNKDAREEYYLIFAKSFSKKIKEWQGKEVRCYDLKEIEKGISK